MVDRSKLIFVNADAEYEEASALDSLSFASYKTASYELTDTLLGKLVNAVNARAGAGDAAKFINTNASGYVDNSFIDVATLSGIDHGSLAGLSDDDHTQYILVDGTRAFTGDQSMGGNLLTNVGASASSITDALHATNKAYVDAVATGLRPKGNVRVATVAAGILASDFEAGDTIDGVVLVAGDRILIKDQADAKENGIYVVQASGAPVRSADQDNAPLAEIVNGVFVPEISEGTVNAGTPWFISSVGTGTDSVHTIGVDDIVWDKFTSPSQLTAGDGIAFTANVVSVRLLASGGIKFSSGELAIEPNDFAGEGLKDDGSDNMAIDWYAPGVDDESTASKAVKVSDLFANGSDQGSNLIGADPTSISQSSQTILQGVLEDMSAAIDDASEEALLLTVSTGNSVAAGDLLQIDGNDECKKLDDSTTAKGVGIAKTAASAGQTVKALQEGEVAAGVLTGATAGVVYYWSTASGLVTAVPSGAGQRVWRVGHAINATDLYINFELIKKNS